MLSKLQMEVLVSYDIADNKKRTRIMNQLKDLGLQPVQKSVMWGRLLPAEISQISRLLDKELKTPVDTAFLIKTKLSQKGVFFGYKTELNGGEHVII